MCIRRLPQLIISIDWRFLLVTEFHLNSFFSLAMVFPTFNSVPSVSGKWFCGRCCFGLYTFLAAKWVGKNASCKCAVCYLVWPRIQRNDLHSYHIVHNLLLFQRNKQEKKQQQQDRQRCNATLNKGKMIPIKSVSFDQLFLLFCSLLCLASVLFLSWKNEMMKCRRIETNAWQQQLPRWWWTRAQGGTS